VTAAGLRADPEVQAGQALRRLRLARNWSQEEVAVRMTAYGYDFHQTMIAKIEAAQRPLRVRELADFAALYGVEVQDLVYPPTRSLPEIDQEIAEVTARLATVQAQAAGASHQLRDARAAMDAAQAAFHTSAAEAAVMEGRLAALRADREKLASWESGGDSLADGSDRTDGEVLQQKRTSVASTAGGTVVRILLGSRLRRLREAAGMSPDRAGYEIRASRSKISRLEAGQVGFKERDIADLLDLYGATDEETRQTLMTLARQANAPGWWHDYSDILPDWFEEYLGLESAATEIRVYEIQFVPGLLQTEDYARAVTLLDRDDLSTRDTDRRVRLRKARQAMLDQPDPLDLRVVLDESVLRRYVGGPAVMRDQLKHLADIAERPNVTLQVLPFQADGPTPGGSFSILRFAEADLSDVVYLEQLTSAIYLDNPKDVDSYLKEMQRLRKQALTPPETTQLLRELLREEAAAEIEVVQIPGQGAWQRQMLVELYPHIEHLPGVLALMDLTSERAPESVSYTEIKQRSGLSDRQQRSDHAALTRTAKRIFERRTWPLAWRQTADGATQYWMPARMADWWRELRRGPIN
jgi:transcriptional regulator with XRE-family HTH domain